MAARHHDYIIIGAGPAGLQMGYFLEKADRDYLILEGSGGSGRFFQHYPRTRSLISFNRPPYPTDDNEYQWRGDWNSLLADDGPRFRDYDQKLLPRADSMVAYLDDFAAFHSLRIRNNARVHSVDKDGEMFRLACDGGEIYTTDRLIVATGLKPHTPAIPGIEHVDDRYDNASLQKEDYAGQRVMILGKRNSAFEIANIAQETASIVLMVSPNPLILAWNSKHSGHTRANLVGPLDTYQLKLVLTKLLDAVVTAIDRHGDTFLVTVTYTHADNEQETFIVDQLINCTGFETDTVFFADNSKPEMTINDRFPALTNIWESQNIAGLFFAGATAQCNDFQKASSPFVGGFRYNIRSLFHILEERDQGVPLPHEKLPADTARLAKWLAHNITRSAGIFFQFEYLSDVLVSDEHGIRYYRELPIDYIHDRFGRKPLYITVSYGWGEYQGDVFSIPRRPQAEYSDRSAFIHPILQAFRCGKSVDTLHMLEDLFAVFHNEAHDSHYVLKRAGLPVSGWHLRHHLKPLERFLLDNLGRRTAEDRVEYAKSG